MRHAAISLKVGLVFISAAILAVAVVVALVLGRADKAGAIPLGPAQIELASGVDTVTYQILGGVGGTAAVYSENQSLNGGSGDRCHSAWSNAIADTSWIGVSSNCTVNGAIGSVGAPRFTDYEVDFDVPAGFVDPSISVSLHGDNIATVFLNDNQIGAQQSPCCPPENFQGDPDVVGSNDLDDFLLGTNTLRFQVEDQGSVTGLDFKAVVTFTQGPAELDHFEIDPIGDPQTAGDPFDVVVTAIDVNGNVKTDYAGPADLSGTFGDAPDGTPPDYGEALVFEDGIATTSVTAFKAEADVWLTVEDAAEGEGEPISATTTPFDVEPGPLDHFVFDPIGTQTAGDDFAVGAVAEDEWENLKTGYNETLTPTHALNPAPRGDTPVVPNFDFSAGEASESLTAFKAESGRTITLTDGLVSDTSEAFGVRHAAPQNIVFGQQPARTLVNTVITPAPTVIVRDLYHNVATQATNPVSMAIGLNPGLGVLLGTTSKAPAAGVATFNNLSITKSGGGYTLVATTAVPAASVTSDPFDVPNTIVECGAGGCSASASNSTTTVQVTVPGQTGGAARALAGVLDDDVAIALDASAGSFACGGATSTAIGSISTVDPPAGYTSANPITVQIVYSRIVPRRGGVSHFVLCKDSGFGTPFKVVPKCAKKKLVAPCETHRSAVGNAGLKFILLVTSSDPRLASK